MTNLRDKVVVVTGASSGVGRAIAEAFGAEGACVGLIARNEEALSHAKAAIERAGGRALVLPTDVSDAAQVEKAAAAVEAEWGRIDVWVNDAMVSVFAPAMEITPEEYARVTAVDYLGFVHGTQAALRRMRTRDQGVIIQVGSALGYCSVPLQSAYCASKAAIRAFTDAVRVELKHDHSRVKISILQLPAVNTPQFDIVRSRLPRRPQPVPPIYQPEIIARAALYAAKHAPRELWLGGPVWKAIVGRFFAPWFVDAYLARTGYASQQTNEPRIRDRSDDIDAPVPGDRGAHGRFDARARRFDIPIALRIHPGLTAASAAALFAGVGLALWRWA